MPAARPAHRVRNRLQEHRERQHRAEADAGHQRARARRRPSHSRRRDCGEEVAWLMRFLSSLVGSYGRAQVHGGRSRAAGQGGSARQRAASACAHDRLQALSQLRRWPASSAIVHGVVEHLTEAPGIGSVSPISSPSVKAAQLSTFSAAMNASCGMSTLPNCRIFFLPSFCFSRSLRLRVMSPP